MKSLTSALSEIVRKFRTLRARRRRKSAIDDLRRQSAKSGFSLDDLTDRQLEAAVTRGAENIEELTPFTGKALFRALRRIAPSPGELRMRRLKQV